MERPSPQPSPWPVCPLAQSLAAARRGGERPAASTQPVPRARRRATIAVPLWALVEMSIRPVRRYSGSRCRPGWRPAAPGRRTSPEVGARSRLVSIRSPRPFASSPSRLADVCDHVGEVDLFAALEAQFPRARVKSASMNPLLLAGEPATRMRSPAARSESTDASGSLNATGRSVRSRASGSAAREMRWQRTDAGRRTIARAGREGR